MPSKDKLRTIWFGGEELLLDPACAVFLPSAKALIVSDLHLEKGSFLGESGAPIPLHDTLDTLQRLAEVIDKHQPQRVILLGDSFHDARAFSRMPKETKDLLHSLMKSGADWEWILGNHDKQLPAGLEGASHARLSIGSLSLSHQPVEGPTQPQIVGHYHPKTVLKVGGNRITGKVFIHDEKLLILPAFGAYTGGLFTHDPVFQDLLSFPRQYIIYRGAIRSI